MVIPFVRFRLGCLPEVVEVMEEEHDRFDNGHRAKDDVSPGYAAMARATISAPVSYAAEDNRQWPENVAENG
jgi:hypothetical protein